MQTQVPVASQVWPSPQAAQLPPFFPQAALVGVTQRPLESQHPDPHDPALQMQAPPLQACPAAQVAHAAPFRPQADVD